MTIIIIIIIIIIITVQQLKPNSSTQEPDLGLQPKKEIEVLDQDKAKSVKITFWYNVF